MLPGVVVGRVWGERIYESLKDKKLLLVIPTDWKKRPKSNDPIVAVDVVGAGAGEFVFYVQAREAAVACGGKTLEDTPPVDAAIVGIIDGVYLEEQQP
ncbi:MAG: EutN/CcmL family microcompartment protein [Endomicrobia bacterium]|nr:EutN/CcmL family microcompartment protein [Endomicrobiia bacterium]MCX7716238.1 EutN/CcmL family microcompartment protein [Endomicrobiia bacterium]